MNQNKNKIDLIKKDNEFFEEIELEYPGAVEIWGKIKGDREFKKLVQYRTEN